MERLSASKSRQYLACTASADLSTAIPGWQPPPPEATTPAATRGSQLHSIMELIGELPKADLKIILYCTEYLYNLRSTRRFKVLTEATTVATFLQSQPHTTTDVVLYLNDEIHIVDYKMGSVPVQADNNHQLMFYAACFRHLAPKAKEVHAHIVQPAIDNMVQTTFTNAEIDQFIADLQEAEKQITDGKLKFVEGDHCTFCPANPNSFGNKGMPACPLKLQRYQPATPITIESVLGVDL